MFMQCIFSHATCINNRSSPSWTLQIFVLMLDASKATFCVFQNDNCLLEAFISCGCSCKQLYTVKSLSLDLCSYLVWVNQIIFHGAFNGTVSNWRLTVTSKARAKLLYLCFLKNCNWRLSWSWAGYWLQHLAVLVLFRQLCLFFHQYYTK